MEQIAGLDGITHLFSIGQGVKIVGESTAQVFDARQQLEVVWSLDAPGLAINSANDPDEYLERLRTDEPDMVFSSVGDVSAAFEQAAETVTREYVTEYRYHAQMEPMDAVANVREDRAEAGTGARNGRPWR